MNGNTISVKAFCEGNASVLRALCVPLASLLEADSELVLHDEEMPVALRTQPQPTNSVSAVLAIFGVIVFVGNWAAKKALDELYAAKIGPKIREVLRSTDAKSLPNVPSKKWLFELPIWYEHESILLLLVLVGDSLQDVEKQERLLPHIHTLAVNWLICNGPVSSVHLYIVESGKTNLEPIAFDHLADANRYLKSLWPVIVKTSDGSVNI